ncbi:hypothetical protein SynBIOSE41_01533 [Synechococcus sp. BIOS-E4-1]|nr:hypothetical protein SynBIOSE41_01533 [Synechococcus sp. BIOS-E4-1]
MAKFPRTNVKFLIIQIQRVSERQSNDSSATEKMEPIKPDAI